MLPKNRFPQPRLTGILFFGALALTPAVPAGSNEIAELIHRAGSAEDEAARSRLLHQLEALPDLDPTLRADLGKLLPVVDDWANGKSKVAVDHSRAAENGYLCRFITSKVKPAGAGPVHPPEPSPGSPLQPFWCLYRGRMLIWRVIQSGPLLRVPERREEYYGEGRRLLEMAVRAFPENRVIRMYLGEPIPWPKPYARDDAAPEWANLQREGLEKLTDIICWWIDERQLPDGQFGGGWGDDVEMWRWWAPVLLAFDDPKVNAAQERLSSGIFLQPHMRLGFTSRLTDVEHSNEDTTDTILPMLHLKPDDPLWKQRAMRLAELMRGLWTGRNERGFLQFKSIYFSADRLDASPPRAYDTVYHTAVVQPALLCWQRTGDRALGGLFGDWLKLWIDATARAGNGKPAGIMPSAVRWPDGFIGAPREPWWQPFSPGHNDALYNWPGAARLMTGALLLASHMLEDERYLEPIRSMAAIRLRNPDETHPPAPGSEAWCARNMGGFLPDTLAKYRFLTGDAAYDRLLLREASGYIQYRLCGDERALARALERNAEAFRSNWEGYTSEMRWTDRVLSFSRNYLQYLPRPAPPAPAPDLLYFTATGDPGSPLVFPLNRVRWITPPRDLAALVAGGGRHDFEARLFNFGSAPRPMGAELYLLADGPYDCILTASATGEVLFRRSHRVEGPRSRVAFELPARTLCLLRVERKRD
ncbi:MAG: hypothetical protein HY717_01295 [Planctomycetes bacterium]|nr:hypothetical protein [Planctomycetota bacterium]